MAAAYIGQPIIGIARGTGGDNPQESKNLGS